MLLGGHISRCRGLEIALEGNIMISRVAYSIGKHRRYVFFSKDAKALLLHRYDSLIHSILERSVLVAANLAVGEPVKRRPIPAGKAVQHRVIPSARPQRYQPTEGAAVARQRII